MTTELWVILITAIAGCLGDLGVNDAYRIITMEEVSPASSNRTRRTDGSKVK